MPPPRSWCFGHDQSQHQLPIRRRPGSHSLAANSTIGTLFTIGGGIDRLLPSIHNNAWNTQQWAVEPVTNTEYVRVRNTGTNLYLHVTSPAEQATVGTAGFNSTATGEMWTVEAVSNSGDFRLKSLFSGKYLTMADPNSFPNTPDFLPIFSQGLNTGWNTQRWIIR